jgi:hypothetical protein
MTAPPWGHKPLPVADETDYWTDPPPRLSPRVEYWLKRLTDGTWTPNKYFNRECYHCRSVWLGVWIWEYFNIIAPAMTGREEAAAA